MNKNTKKKYHYIIPIFIPDAACPHRCIFCNQKQITGINNIPGEEEVEKIIQSHLATIPVKNSNIEIGFFGGSFTAIPLEEQEKYLRIAGKFLSKAKINGIRVSTRPDCINDSIVDFLKKYLVATVELGVQSMDDEVLKASGRGHPASDTEKASKLLKDKGFRLGLQMMIGLPGDTAEKSKNTARKIIELKADYTRIYPVVVIRNTELERLFLQKKYQPLSLEDAVSRTAEVYWLFINAGIKILRVGLHPSEGLLNGSNIVAGPFHASFRELVLTSIWNDIFANADFDSNAKKITIYVTADQLNHATGYLSTNKTSLQKKYSVVNFKTDSNLSAFSYYVNYY